jgi:uncharacterized protein (TIGR02145 family)
MKNYYASLLLICSTNVFLLSCSKEESNTNKSLSMKVKQPITVSQVKIGNQVWTTKNLNVTVYRNGDLIPQVQDAAQWVNLTTGAWCYYGIYGGTYGKLYNWYAVNDPRGLAPAGYHIPTDSEWEILVSYLGGPNVAGGRMKTFTNWLFPNYGATNDSGFSGLPGGSRSYEKFVGLTAYGAWWTASDSIGYPLYRSLHYDGEYVGRGFVFDTKGFSVRCIKN